MLRKFLALAAIAVASITPAHYAAAQPTITLPDSLPGKMPNARAQATNIISSGAATPTTATFILSAESGTADDLVNVIVTGWNVGDTLKVKADAGDTITLKHGTGNITTDTGRDFELTDEAYVWLDVTASGVTLNRGGGGGEPNFLATASSAPTTDKNGDALSGDELYYDTTAKNFLRYNSHLGGFLADLEFKQVADDTLFTSSSGDGITLNSSCVATRGNGSSFPVVEDMPFKFAGMANTDVNGKLYVVVSRSGATFTYADFFDGTCDAESDAGPNEGGATIKHIRYKYVFGADPAKDTLAPAFELTFATTIPKLRTRSFYGVEVGDSFDMTCGRASGNLAAPASVDAGTTGCRFYIQNYDSTSGQQIPVHGLSYAGSSLQARFPYWGRLELKDLTLEQTSNTERGAAFVIAPIKENTVAAYDVMWVLDRGIVNIGDLGQPAAYPHQSFNDKGGPRLNNGSGVDVITTKDMDTNYLLANLGDKRFLSFREVNHADTRTTFDPASAVNTSTDVITINSHGFSDGDYIYYTNGGGTSVGGLMSNVVYAVRDADTNTFKLAEGAGGTAIDLTTGAAGSAHTFSNTSEDWNKYGVDFRLVNNQLKFQRVSNGSTADVMALYYNSARADLFGLLNLEGDDSDPAHFVLRNTDQTGEKQFYCLENDANGELVIGSSDTLGGCNPRLTMDETASLTLNGEADSANGVVLNVHQNRGTANVLDNDDVFAINAYGDTDTTADRLYGSIFLNIEDATNASSGAAWNIFSRVNNNAVRQMEIYDGVRLGSPTGGFKGNGTLNAIGVYDDNTLLTDYVFDKLFGEEGVYSARVKEKYDALDVTMFDQATYAKFWKDNGRLYAFPDQNDVIDGVYDKSLGELVQLLIQDAEIKAVHIDAIDQRLTSLEGDYSQTKKRMAELFCLLADNSMEACEAQ